MDRKSILIIIFILILTSVLFACSGSDDEENALLGQLTALAQTATAGARDTGPGPEVLTAQAGATATASALQVEKATIQVEQELVNNATVQAAAPIQQELVRFDVDPDKGQLAFIHSPVTMEVEGYQSADYANDFPGVIAADFVFSSDITWNTEYGTSGCGYMFRSDGNQDKPSQYMALITRGGTGHVIFVVLDEGDPAAGYDIYPRTEDPTFDWHNDATNELTVVGRGNLFDIYTNGQKVGTVDVSQPPEKPIIPPPPPLPIDQTNETLMQAYQQELDEYNGYVSEISANFNSRISQYQEDAPLIDQGFVGMLTLSESGRTVCEFNDTWLWLIEE